MAFEPMEDWKMGKKRHKAEEIVANFWQVEVLAAQRRTVAEGTLIDRCYRSYILPVAVFLTVGVAIMF